MLRNTNTKLTHNPSLGFLLAAATLPVELLDNSAKLELSIPVSGPPIGYICALFKQSAGRCVWFMLVCARRDSSI